MRDRSDKWCQIQTLQGEDETWLEENNQKALPFIWAALFGL
jgi:hypothetical protein